MFLMVFDWQELDHDYMSIPFQKLEIDNTKRFMKTYLHCEQGYVCLFTITSVMRHAADRVKVGLAAGQGRRSVVQI